MVRAARTGRRIAAIAAAAAAWLLVPASPALASPYRSPGGLTDAQSSGGGLGQSVSISSDGTVAVVGEPNYGGGAGAALVYANSNGTWSYVQRLTPSGETGAGHFGAAVSMDGSGQALVVGAPDDNGGVGSAWAFALSNGTWTQQGHLLGGAGEAGNGKFGASVAVASGGTLAMVGAPMSDAGEGQVFTFYYYPNDGWFLFEHMDRAGVSGAAHFGASVAVDGSAALVGAPNAASGDGAVYVYSYFGLESPYWIDGPVIQSPAAGAHFGASVAMSLGGDYDIVGAPLASSGNGAVYEYRHDGTRLAVFTDPSASTGGHFGASVSLAGTTMDELLVGASGDASGAGAAYDFDATNGANWVSDGTAISPISAPAVGDAYGTSVAVSSDASGALVGAPGAGSADGIATHFARITAPDPPASAQAVAGAESAVVSWGAPNTGGSPITGYTVTASPGGLTCSTTTALTCAVVGLTDGHAYTFTVTATNNVGTSAASSPSNSVTPEPSGGAGGGSGGGGGGPGGGGGGGPGGGGGTGGGGGSGGGGAGGRGGGSGGSGGGPGGGGGSGGGTSGNGHGKLPGTHRGRATAPSRPSGSLTVTKRTETTITLSWGASNGKARPAGYDVYEYLRGSWTLVGTTGASRRSFVRGGLRHKARYRFEVRAYDAAGGLSAPLVGVWSATL